MSLLMVEEIDLAYALTVGEARDFREQGYEPVECAFGGESVVGGLLLDHHGKYSGEEAVSIKAARLRQGGISRNKFVVTGKADCDMCYAIVALSGRIPVNLDEAAAIAELDLDWIGRDRRGPRYIRSLMFDLETETLSPSLESSVRAVKWAEKIFNGNYGDEDTARALEMENERIENAPKAIRRMVRGKVALTVSSRKGFDVWFNHAPVVVNYDPEHGLITFWACQKLNGFETNKTGFDVLGPRGLVTHYAEIDRVLGVEGSGGREVVGGSPRNAKFSEEDAKRVYEYFKSVIL